MRYFLLIILICNVSAALTIQNADQEPNGALMMAFRLKAKRD